MRSVAPDTLQPASDWLHGPGWFRHHQHRLGQIGVGVGEPVLRLLRRYDSSQCAIESVEFQVSRTPEVESRARASRFLSDSRTGNTGPTARGSVTDGTELVQHSRLGIARTDATTPVATRTSHSWEQIIGFCNPASRRCS